MIILEKKIKNSPSGFTLTELMVVVIIVGILAAFTIPNFQKRVERSHERNLVGKLMTIHGANEIYKARNSAYLPGAGLNLAQINAGLSINIISGGEVYLYDRTAVNTYSAMAQWTEGAGFTLKVGSQIALNTVAPFNPCCAAGACPSLPVCTF